MLCGFQLSLGCHFQKNGDELNPGPLLIQIKPRILTIKWDEHHSKCKLLLRHNLLWLFKIFIVAYPHARLGSFIQFTFKTEKKNRVIFSTWSTDILYPIANDVWTDMSPLALWCWYYNQKCIYSYFGHTLFYIACNKPLFQQLISIIPDIIIIVVQMIVLAVLMPWMNNLPPVC